MVYNYDNAGQQEQAPSVEELKARAEAILNRYVTDPPGTDGSYEARLQGAVREFDQSVAPSLIQLGYSPNKSRESLKARFRERMSALGPAQDAVVYSDTAQPQQAPQPATPAPAPAPPNQPTGQAPQPPVEVPQAKQKSAPTTPEEAGQQSFDTIQQQLDTAQGVQSAAVDSYASVTDLRGLQQATAQRPEDSMGAVESVQPFAGTAQNELQGEQQAIDLAQANFNPYRQQVQQRRLAIDPLAQLDDEALMQQVAQPEPHFEQALRDAQVSVLTLRPISALSAFNRPRALPEGFVQKLKDAGQPEYRIQILEKIDPEDRPAALRGFREVDQKQEELLVELNAIQKQYQNLEDVADSPQVRERRNTLQDRANQLLERMQDLEAENPAVQAAMQQSQSRRKDTDVGRTTAVVGELNNAAYGGFLDAASFVERISRGVEDLIPGGDDNSEEFELRKQNVKRDLQTILGVQPNEGGVYGLMQDVSAGLGSTIPFLLTGAGSAPAALTKAATLGSVLNMESTTQEIGQTAKFQEAMGDNEAAARVRNNAPYAISLAGLIGTLEGVAGAGAQWSTKAGNKALQRVILGSQSPRVGQQAYGLYHDAVVGSLSRKGLSQGAKSLGQDVAKESAEEALQEGTAQVLNNLNAAQFIDYNRYWAEGLVESASIGALVGGGLKGSTELSARGAQVTNQVLQGRGRQLFREGKLTAQELADAEKSREKAVADASIYVLGSLQTPEELAEELAEEDAIKQPPIQERKRDEKPKPKKGGKKRKDQRKTPQEKRTVEVSQEVEEEIPEAIKRAEERRAEVVSEINRVLAEYRADPENRELLAELDELYEEDSRFRFLEQEGLIDKAQQFLQIRNNLEDAYEEQAAVVEALNNNEPGAPQRLTEVSREIARNESILGQYTEQELADVFHFLGRTEGRPTQRSVPDSPLPNQRGDIETFELDAVRKSGGRSLVAPVVQIAQGDKPTPGNAQNMTVVRVGGKEHLVELDGDNQVVAYEDGSLGIWENRIPEGRNVEEGVITLSPVATAYAGGTSDAFFEAHKDLAVTPKTDVASVLSSLNEAVGGENYARTQISTAAKPAPAFNPVPETAEESVALNEELSTLPPTLEEAAQEQTEAITPQAEEQQQEVEETADEPTTPQAEEATELQETAEESTEGEQAEQGEFAAPQAEEQQQTEATAEEVLQEEGVIDAPEEESAPAEATEDAPPEGEPTPSPTPKKPRGIKKPKARAVTPRPKGNAGPFPVGYRKQEFKQESSIRLGKKADVIIGKKERPVQYAVVELDSILPSHNPNGGFAPTENYPQQNGASINDRNYQTDKDAKREVREGAAELKPAFLLQDTVTAEGTPIITEDGVVVSGNGRTMMLKAADETKLDDYQKALYEKAEQFGIDPEELTSFANPVLVRVDSNFPAYTKGELSSYNVSEQKAKSKGDVAGTTVSRMKSTGVDQSFAELVSEEEYDKVAQLERRPAFLDALSNLLAGKVIPTNEIGKYFTLRGNSTILTDDGKKLLRDAMLSLAMPANADSTRAGDLRAKLAQLPKMGGTSVEAKLIEAAPYMSEEVKQRVAEVIDFMDVVRISGKSLVEYLTSRKTLIGRNPSLTRKAFPYYAVLMHVPADRIVRGFKRISEDTVETPMFGALKADPNPAFYMVDPTEVEGATDANGNPITKDNVKKLKAEEFPGQSLLFITNEDAREEFDAVYNGAAYSKYFDKPYEVLDDENASAEEQSNAANDQSYRGSPDDAYNAQNQTVYEANQYNERLGVQQEGILQAVVSMLSGLFVDENGKNIFTTDKETGGGRVRILEENQYEQALLDLGVEPRDENGDLTAAKYVGRPRRGGRKAVDEAGKAPTQADVDKAAQEQSPVFENGYPLSHDTIFINKAKANASTPIWEFGRVFISRLALAEPALLAKVRNQIANEKGITRENTRRFSEDTVMARMPRGNVNKRYQDMNSQGLRTTQFRVLLKPLPSDRLQTFYIPDYYVTPDGGYEGQLFEVTEQGVVRIVDNLKKRNAIVGKWVRGEEGFEFQGPSQRYLDAVTGYNEQAYLDAIDRVLLTEVTDRVLDKTYDPKTGTVDIDERGYKNRVASRIVKLWHKLIDNLPFLGKFPEKWKAYLSPEQIVRAVRSMRDWMKGREIADYTLGDYADLMAKDLTDGMPIARWSILSEMSAAGVPQGIAITSGAFSPEGILQEYDQGLSEKAHNEIQSKIEGAETAVQLVIRGYQLRIKEIFSKVKDLGLRKDQVKALSGDLARFSRTRLSNGVNEDMLKHRVAVRTAILRVYVAQEAMYKFLTSRENYNKGGVLKSTNPTDTGRKVKERYIKLARELNEAAMEYKRQKAALESAERTQEVMARQTAIARLGDKASEMSDQQILEYGQRINNAFSGKDVLKGAVEEEMQKAEAALELQSKAMQLTDDMGNVVGNLEKAQQDLQETVEQIRAFDEETGGDVSPRIEATQKAAQEVSSLFAEQLQNEYGISENEAWELVEGMAQAVIPLRTKIDEVSIILQEVLGKVQKEYERVGAPSEQIARLATLQATIDANLNVYVSRDYLLFDKRGNVAKYVKDAIKNLSRNPKDAGDWAANFPVIARLLTAYQYDVENRIVQAKKLADDAQAEVNKAEQRRNDLQMQLANSEASREFKVQLANSLQAVDIQIEQLKTIAETQKEKVEQLQGQLSVQEDSTALAAMQMGENEVDLNALSRFAKSMEESAGKQGGTLERLVSMLTYAQEEVERGKKKSEEKGAAPRAKNAYAPFDADTTTLEERGSIPAPFADILSDAQDIPPYMREFMQERGPRKSPSELAGVFMNTVSRVNDVVIKTRVMMNLRQTLLEQGQASLQQTQKHNIQIAPNSLAQMALEGLYVGEETKTRVEDMVERMEASTGLFDKINRTIQRVMVVKPRQAVTQMFQNIFLGAFQSGVFFQATLQDHAIAARITGANTALEATSPSGNDGVSQFLALGEGSKLDTQQFIQNAGPVLTFMRKHFILGGSTMQQVIRSSTDVDRRKAVREVEKEFDQMSNEPIVNEVMGHSQRMFQQLNDRLKINYISPVAAFAYSSDNHSRMLAFLARLTYIANRDGKKADVAAIKKQLVSADSEKTLDALYKNNQEIFDEAFEYVSEVTPDYQKLRELWASRKILDLFENSVFKFTGLNNFAKIRVSVGFLMPILIARRHALDLREAIRRGNPRLMAFHSAMLGSLAASSVGLPYVASATVSRFIGVLMGQLPAVPDEEEDEEASLANAPESERMSKGAAYRQMLPPWMQNGPVFLYDWSKDNQFGVQMPKRVVDLDFVWNGKFLYNMGRVMYGAGQMIAGDDAAQAKEFRDAKEATSELGDGSFALQLIGTGLQAAKGEGEENLVAKTFYRIDPYGTIRPLVSGADYLWGGDYHRIRKQFMSESQYKAWQEQTLGEGVANSMLGNRIRPVDAGRTIGYSVMDFNEQHREENPIEEAKSMLTKLKQDLDKHEEVVIQQKRLVNDREEFLAWHKEYKKRNEIQLKIEQYRALSFVKQDKIKLLAAAAEFNAANEVLKSSDLLLKVRALQALGVDDATIYATLHGTFTGIGSVPKGLDRMIAVDPSLGEYEEFIDDQLIDNLEKQIREIQDNLEDPDFLKKVEDMLLEEQQRFREQAIKKREEAK